MACNSVAKANPAVAIGSYPFFDPQHGPNTNVVLRARDAHACAQAKRAVEACWSECAWSAIEAGELALSRRKQGFESPRERQRFQHLSAKMEPGPAGISNFSPMDGASDDQFEVTL